ncbi:hypothetical protein N9D52_06585, partial [Flavobacteriaceae bacterium]|nr:hypothetical protein [Flavobacteriaceae bacterium]
YIIKTERKILNTLEMSTRDKSRFLVKNNEKRQKKRNIRKRKKGGKENGKIIVFCPKRKKNKKLKFKTDKANQ